MLLEEKFLEFHRYASNHNLPLEAISVGDENKVPGCVARNRLVFSRWFGRRDAYSVHSNRHRGFS